jgi:outer membrane protein TolC
MKPAGLERFLGLVLLLAPTLNVATAAGAEHPLTLNEAIAMALEKNEGLLIERESLTAAGAEVDGARGAYDPILGVDGGWWRSREPVNSAFSGAPPGEIAPEFESTRFGVGVRQLLPTGGELSLRGRGGRETTDGTVARLSPAYDTQVGVELRQPLLRDRAIDPARLSVRVAQAGRQVAVASLRRTVTETVAAVERSYWGLTAARLGVSVREQAVQLAQEQLAETRTRVESGVVPETELAQPRAELERRRGELLAAREALARSENGLKLLILADGDETLWMSQIVPGDSAAIAVAPVDLATSLQRALSARPELEEVEAALDRRRAESAFARDAAWPSLDAVVSYDRFGFAGSPNPSGPGDPLPPQLGGDLGTSFETLGDGELDAARVALVLELPVFNRKARADAVVARSAERQVEVALERTRKAIRAEVLDAAAALETAGQRIEATRSGREAAEIQLSAERDRYLTGLSTNFLVLTRQNDLSRARLDEISALTDYRMARTEMARATASLIEERGIEVGGTGQGGGSR